jgi:hypothetical protein
MMVLVLYGLFWVHSVVFGNDIGGVYLVLSITIILVWHWIFEVCNYKLQITMEKGGLLQLICQAPVHRPLIMV